MNRNTNLVRTTTRIAATAGLGLVGLVGLGASTALADTPPAPDDILDIADAPECTPWSYDGLSWYHADTGNNSRMFMIGYDDGVNTCDADVSLRIYTLASPTATIDDPGSSLYFNGGSKLSIIEPQTLIEGGLYNWAGSQAGECSEFRFSIDGVSLSTLRVTDDCDKPEHPGDFTDGDGGEPEHPDEFDSGIPDGDQPGDEPGDEPGQGGELPSTGTTSSTLVALATALLALGGVAVRSARPSISGAARV